MTRTLQPLSIAGLISKFAKALRISEKKSTVEFAPSEPVMLTVKALLPPPMDGKMIAELQKLADTLGFAISVLPDASAALIVLLQGPVQVSFYQETEGP